MRHIVTEDQPAREVLSPERAYAALAGLSTLVEPTYAQRKRMRVLARALLDAVDAAQRGQVAA